MKHRTGKGTKTLADDWDGADESTRLIRSFLRDRSGLPDDGCAPRVTLGVVVNLFKLLLRPGEKLLAYADRPVEVNESGDSSRQAVDLVALTDMRMVRSRVYGHTFIWKEAAHPVDTGLGFEASVGRAAESDPRWWIDDEPLPPRFFIELPEPLVLDGEQGSRWEWTTSETPWARRPVLTLNSWSESLAKMRPRT